MTIYSDGDSSSESEADSRVKEHDREDSEGLEEGHPEALQRREEGTVPRISPLRPAVDTMQVQAEEEAKRVNGSRGEKEGASVSKRRPFLRLAIFVAVFVIAMIFLVRTRKPPIPDEMKFSGKDVPSLPAPAQDSVKAPRKPLHHHDPLFQIL